MDTGKRRILLVDDEENILFSLSLILESEGYQVTTAINGHRATEIISASRENGAPFDLVITDLCMPEMNGFELITWIRNFDDKIKTILYSGCDRQEILTLAGEAALCTLALKKPFKRETLLALIESIWV